MRRKERGAVNIALLIFAMLMTAVGVVLFAVISMAAGSVQRHQSAADAAALAGAGAFEKYGATYFAPGWAKIDIDLPLKVNQSGPCPAVVRQEASTYAQRNDTTLTSCRMDRFGEVSVRVRGEVPTKGRKTHDAVASAAWGLPLQECEADPLFDPSVVAPGTPTPTWMECGRFKIHLMYDGLVYKMVPWGQVKNHIEPRLTD